VSLLVARRLSDDARGGYQALIRIASVVLWLAG
jgi:hypothetical protein